MKNQILETALTAQQKTEIAIRVWDNLQPAERLKLWYKYQETTFTPSKSPNDLTGREIEQIINSIQNQQP